MSAADRLCNSVASLIRSALAPTAAVMNVCFVLRKQNLPVSSCAPLLQKKDIAVLLSKCCCRSVFMLSPDTGCAALFVSADSGHVSKYILSGMTFTFLLSGSRDPSYIFTTKDERLLACSRVSVTSWIKAVTSKN